MAVAGLAPRCTGWLPAGGVRPALVQERGFGGKRLEGLAGRLGSPMWSRIATAYGVGPKGLALQAGCWRG